VELIEFITKLTEQHKSLLKVVELQNNSIHALNERVNAMNSTNLIVFAMLLEASTIDRTLMVRHLELMLENPVVVKDQQLTTQLQELLAICRSDSDTPPHTGKKMPSWFKGVVQGGLADSPSVKNKPD